MNSSIITLLSDLGTKDASATIAKAILMRHVPGCAIVDISHSVKEYNLQKAAFLLLSAYAHFTKGTVHVVAVDIFSGEMPRMILREKDGYFFIAPDNGVLALAFGTGLERTMLCCEFAKPYSLQGWVAKAGEVIQAINAQPDGVHFAQYDIKSAPVVLQPKAGKNGIECNVLHIDRFENIVLDITRSQFYDMVKDRPFSIMLRKFEDITSVSINYNDVPVGSPLCRFNSSGFMEIALNRDKAASLLGLGDGNMGIRNPTIRISY